MTGRRQLPMESLDGRRGKACAGPLAAARRLGGAAVQRHVTQLETDQPVIAVARESLELLELLELLHDASIDPGVAASPQRGRTACRVSDLVLRAAEHQHLHEFVEDQPVIDPGPCDSPEDAGHRAAEAAVGPGARSGRGCMMELQARAAPVIAEPSQVPR